MLRNSPLVLLPASPDESLASKVASANPKPPLEATQLGKSNLSANTLLEALSIGGTQVPSSALGAEVPLLLHAKPRPVNEGSKIVPSRLIQAALREGWSSDIKEFPTLPRIKIKSRVNKSAVEEPKELDTEAPLTTAPAEPVVTAVLSIAATCVVELFSTTSSTKSSSSIPSSSSVSASTAISSQLTPEKKVPLLLPNNNEEALASTAMPAKFWPANDGIFTAAVCKKFFSSSSTAPTKVLLPPKHVDTASIVTTSKDDILEESTALSEEALLEQLNTKYSRELEGILALDRKSDPPRYVYKHQNGDIDRIPTRFVIPSAPLVRFLKVKDKEHKLKVQFSKLDEWKCKLAYYVISSELYDIPGLKISSSVEAQEYWRKLVPSDPNDKLIFLRAIFNRLYFRNDNLEGKLISPLAIGRHAFEYPDGSRILIPANIDIKPDALFAYLKRLEEKSLEYHEAED